MNGAADLVAVIIGLLMTTSGVVAGVWAVARFKSVEQTLDLQAKALASTSSAYKDLELRQQQERFECNRQLAEMRGSVQALTGTLAGTIVTAVVNAWKEQNKS